jgi:hypothetical protein
MPQASDNTTVLPDAATRKPRKNPARRKSERAKSGLDQPQPAIQVPAPRMPVRQFSAPSVLKAAVATVTATSSVTTSGGRSTKTVTKTTSSQQVARLQPSRTNSASATTVTTLPRNGQGSLAFMAPAIVTGGLIGCCAGAAIIMAVTVFYDFCGAKAAITTARAARLCVDNLTEEIETSLTGGTYNADEALDILRRTTLAYAMTVPGGAPMVERIFREVNTLRQSRGAEVDKILVSAYDELYVAGRKGAAVDDMQSILLKYLFKLSAFAGRASEDVVLRNPSLKTRQQTPAPERVPTARVNLTVRHKQQPTNR